MKKTVALLLTFLLLLPCFTSCTSTDTQTVRSRSGDIKTKIEFSDYIADLTDDLIVLNIHVSGDGEKHENLTLEVEADAVISTPDADASANTFQARYEFDGELDTSVIINMNSAPGVVYNYFYGEEDYVVKLSRITISLRSDYLNQIVCDETLYVSGDGKECFISESKFSAKYKAIVGNNDIARDGGSKIEALWLLLTGRI